VSERACIWWVAAAAAVVASAVVTACSGDSGTGAPSTDGTSSTAATGDLGDGPIEIVDTGAWPMHPIDGRFRGANALGAADVDGDGWTDYVTNYEFDQRWIIALHPGPDGDPRASWPTVEVWKPDPFVAGNGKNPESTALGDFDGDGDVDAAGAHGFSDAAAFEGSAPGIHLVWGPPADRVADPGAWQDGGWVPATVDVGHPHWVVAHDVNSDGLTDVAFGGRRHGGGGGYDSPDSPDGNGTTTGIGWLEAPADPAARRDLAQWAWHRIDAETPSGHGFVFADLDGDGDDDIVDANADFDTPEQAEDVAWYENPGDGSPEQRSEWRRTVLYRSSDFYAKPSVAVGDLDGDGDPDIATQTDDEIVLLRNRGGRAPGFDALALPKPEEIRWRSRPVRLADFDRDGDLDLFGMLIHADSALPPEKASAFLMLNEGDPFSEDGWRLLPVKWGPGQTMVVPGFGEKWDQADVTDVDGDGDLDVVANCEEWWATPQFEVAPFFTEGLSVSSVAVVWFENTLGDAPSVVAEQDGEIEIEAERPSVISDSTWVERAPVNGDTGDPSAPAPPVAAVQAHNGLRPPDGGMLAADSTSGMGYSFEADGGEYVVWARVFVPVAFSPDVGGDGADSAWLSFDDGAAQVLGDAAGGPDGSWRWVRLPGEQELDKGRHELTVRVREHGMAIDRLLLGTDEALTPS
jgi:hypothetical protein